MTASWSVVDEMLYRRRKIDYPVLRDRWRLHSVNEVLAASMREQLTMHSVSMAMSEFDPASESPVPSRLNRHASVHCVDDLQRNPANAVYAALIAASVVARSIEPESHR
jgi:hypothetical protein